MTSGVSYCAISACILSRQMRSRHAQPLDVVRHENDGLRMERWMFDESCCSRLTGDPINRANGSSIRRIGGSAANALRNRPVDAVRQTVGVDSDSGTRPIEADQLKELAHAFLDAFWDPNFHNAEPYQRVSHGHVGESRDWIIPMLSAAVRSFSDGHASRRHSMIRLIRGIS